jgi:hypothetical protein
MLLPVIFACVEINPVANEETETEEETTSGEEADISEETTADEEDYKNNEEITEEQENGEESYYDMIANDILKYIKEKNYQELAGIMAATDPEAYKFIQDMTVDSYEIVEEKEEDYSKYFKIKFNISKSDNNYFPVGESYWDLIVENGMEIVSLFRPSDEKNFDYVNRRTDDKEYDFCFSFSHHLNIFETATDFNTVININYDGWGGIVHSIIHYYGATAPDRISPLPESAIDDYMIKTTGITGIDYTSKGLVSKEDISLICIAHGGSWMFWREVSKNYDENEKIYTVVIDYFADTSLLVVAKTMEYKFTANGDGTFKMLSTDLVYDSGYNMARGSI